jgi:hypothetical protein
MGIDPMNNISIIIRILFAVTIFQYLLDLRIVEPPSCTLPPEIIPTCSE